MTWGAAQGAAELELPSGAAMVIPAGPHQVTNIGDTDVKILFVEVRPAFVLVYSTYLRRALATMMEQVVLSKSRRCATRATRAISETVWRHAL